MGEQNLLFHLINKFYCWICKLCLIFTATVHECRYNHTDLSVIYFMGMMYTSPNYTRFKKKMNLKIKAILKTEVGSLLWPMLYAFMFSPGTIFTGYNIAPAGAWP